MQLMDAMTSPAREIVLKSCTGSGKTIILTHFMDEYFKSHEKVVFVWLTPGKGNLEEQSKEKMDLYIHGSQTKLLEDVMTSGFQENDACFINWEKLTKKGNNALKDSERTNFLEHIEKALDSGLRFVIIVDESHQNDTVKSNDITAYFKTDKIIRCSATPIIPPDSILIEVPEVEVIAAGLIKKLLVINEGFQHGVDMASQIDYLIGRALDKQRELHSAFLQRGSDVNPLMIIQLPNNSTVLQDEVELYLESKGITYENQQLAVWLSDKKQNLDNIEFNNATPIAVIIKQAVATGWDCPRAHILVKLRENMDETFEIQTIGRIRRMPEAQHYEDDLLDSCYIYTFDETFTDGLRQSMGKNAWDAVKLYINPEYKKIILPCEQKSSIAAPRGPKEAQVAIKKYYIRAYNLSRDMTENKNRLEAAGYDFSKEIIRSTKTGMIHMLSREEIDQLKEVGLREKLDTHRHGRAYHHYLADIGLNLGLTYDAMNTIIRRLFDKNVRYNERLLALDTREVYAFVINNAYKIKNDLHQAMIAEPQISLSETPTAVKDFHIPQELLFTYDGKAKVQTIMEKSVYVGYRSSAEPRSEPEKAFECFIEDVSTRVKWFYKNGDKGADYLSIVYTDNFEKQRLFFPDYIVGTDKGIWIIETKGGFDKYGTSQDIDQFTPFKFYVLRDYLIRHGLHGGIVRMDKQSQKLCICMDEYNEDIKSDSWELLKDVL